MFRFRYLIAFLISTQLMAQTPSQDDVKDALAHAEALYYEAQFKDSIELLTRIDGMLQGKPERLQDRIRTKLQLALSNIGLNETDQAKAYLRQLYALDADYAMNAAEFSPKVVALANDARSEQNTLRCQGFRDDGRAKLQNKDAIGLQNLITTNKTKCADLASLEPDAAELLYKTGLESYKRGDFVDALTRFRGAVKLAPKHELANQYLDLTQGKLQVSGDRLFIDWQKNFDAKQYTQAAANYKLMASSAEAASPQTLNMIRLKYREQLSTLVDQYNRTCPTGNKEALALVRTQITELLPEPNFGNDITAGMVNCVKQGCVQMGSPLALTRLKQRVNPEITAAIRGFIRTNQTTVRVKIRIDESGNVTVTDVQGDSLPVNNAVRSAVERWKFAPAIDQTGARCVDTEIPIVITP